MHPVADVQRQGHGRRGLCRAKFDALGPELLADLQAHEAFKQLCSAPGVQPLLVATRP